MGSRQAMPMTATAPSSPRGERLSTELRLVVMALDCPFLTDIESCVSIPDMEPRIVDLKTGRPVSSQHLLMHG
jgi:hypothetical protein